MVSRFFFIGEMIYNVRLLLYNRYRLNEGKVVIMFLCRAAKNQAIPELPLKSKAIGVSAGHCIHKGEGKKNILNLVGNIEFANGYDHKALREGEYIENI